MPAEKKIRKKYLKGKPKILPADLQKIVLEYADLDIKGKYDEFYRNGQNHAFTNGFVVAFLPAYLAAQQIYKHFNGANTRFCIGMSIGVPIFAALLPVAGVVAAGTALVDLSMFARRKIKERSAKEVFDAALLIRKNQY